MGKTEMPVPLGIDLAIDEGEMVDIMGTSGPGKSMLMNILGRLDIPTGGRYLIDPTDVSRLSDNRLTKIRSRKIGFVFPSYNLVPRASAIQCRTGLDLCPSVGSARPRPLVEVGLGDRENHLSNELSGGQ